MFGFGNAGKARGGWFARQRLSAPVAVDFGRSSVRLLQLGAAGVSYRCLAAADLQALVDNGYCSAEDLTNQVDSTKGWVWSATTRKFTPQP